MRKKRTRFGLDLARAWIRNITRRSSPGLVPLVEVWGMTETGRVFGDVNEPRAVGSRAFGKPLVGPKHAWSIEMTTTFLLTNPVSFSCVTARTIPATVSSPDTSRTKKQPKRHGAVDGFTRGYGSAG